MVTRLEVNDPTKEVVILEVSDGETYVSRKFGTVYGGVATGIEDVDAYVNVVPSGATVTINYAGQTDKDVCLVLFGRK